MDLLTTTSVQYLKLHLVRGAVANIVWKRCAAIPA